MEINVIEFHRMLRWPSAVTDKTRLAFWELLHLGIFMCNLACRFIAYALLDDVEDA
jgi:hypothetical protein